jgi:hypothetical protein
MARSMANLHSMHSHSPEGLDAPIVHGRRRVRTVTATTETDLARLVGLVRGWTCEITSVALDDQAARLHLPLAPPAERPRPGAAVAGELVVRRVAEFSMENGAGRRRRFALEGLLYDASSGRLSIRSATATQFVIGVDRLDVGLRLALRPFGGPRP